MAYLRASSGARSDDGGTVTDQSGAFRTDVKPHVLVVDDDSAVARQLALALELEGVMATTVTDGEGALALLMRAETEHPVDLVLVELMLPRRSGLELARELRARYPELRIVLTGAYHLSERQLTRAGCNAIAFVPKPCEPAVVAAFVKRKVVRHT